MNPWHERYEEWAKQPDDARSVFDIDYARVVHSGSFRRLQGKTQILNLGDSDFYRTRLTHSLEVAQIALGIVRQLQKDYTEHACSTLLPEQNLIQSICLTHDLGHPPFGHGGEVALNYCMKEQGGFEANGQTLRILTKLEKFSKAAGSNLSRRTLLGILKYPVSYSAAQNPSLVPRLASGTSTIQVLDREASKPPKCYHDTEKDIVEWLLRPLSPTDRALFCESEDGGKDKHRKSVHKSFDCSIMDFADDIAYGVHDLEDVVALGLITERQFRLAVSESSLDNFLESLRSKYPEEFNEKAYDTFIDKLFSDGESRKRQISRLVHYLLTGIEPIEDIRFTEPLLRYRVRLKAHHQKLLDALQDFVFGKVVKNPGVQHLEFKGQQMVIAVFEAFQTDPKAFLPSITYKKFESEDRNVRVICDHIAGMTDHFLLRTYERLFSPRMGSIFDRL